MNRNVLVAVLTYNEGEKLRKLLPMFRPGEDYRLLFIDDGSTDNSGALIKNSGYDAIRHPENLGVGAGIRTAVRFARENAVGVIVVMSANGKMLPEEISRLVKPILDGQADYVQGSRNLAGGTSPNLPLFRKVGIRLFTLFANLVLGFKGTDVTCGFRAWRLAVLEAAGVDISQTWLGRYEMEYYIHYKAIKNGFRVTEVPVSMVYPEERKNYSKIKPITGWWSMIRPWIYLTLRIKK